MTTLHVDRGGARARRSRPTRSSRRSRCQPDFPHELRIHVIEYAAGALLAVPAGTRLPRRRRRHAAARRSPRARAADDRGRGAPAGRTRLDRARRVRARRDRRRGAGAAPARASRAHHRRASRRIRRPRCATGPTLIFGDRPAPARQVGCGGRACWPILDAAARATSTCACPASAAGGLAAETLAPLRPSRRPPTQSTQSTATTDATAGADHRATPPRPCPDCAAARPDAHRASDCTAHWSTGSEAPRWPESSTAWSCTSLEHSRAYRCRFCERRLTLRNTPKSELAESGNPLTPLELR